MIKRFPFLSTSVSGSAYHLKLLLSPSFSWGQRLFRLTGTYGYYFRVINSYCIQNGCFLVTSRFVLAPCVRYGYNSLKYCWFCDEKLMLSCCAERDTHFSAFICVSDSVSVQLIASFFSYFSR